MSAAPSIAVDSDSCESPAINGESATPDHSSAVSQRRSWAQRYLATGAGWPLYGSADWCELAVDDPRRVAACVAAAEVYTRRYDNLANNVRGELEVERLAFKHAEDAEYQALARQHRDQWSGRRMIVPSFEQRQCEQVAAAARVAARANRRGEA